MISPWQDPRVRAGFRQQLAMRRRMLGGGAVPIGWKVGFGSPKSLALMEMSAPLVGFITDITVVESGETVTTTGWENGVVEFEVALHLSSDVRSGASKTAIAAAVSGIGPAIEIANVDLPIEPEGVQEIVAGDIFHEAVVFGDPDPSRAGLETEGMTARILIDGEEHAVVDDLEALTGDYISIVRAVANTLALGGERLRAGEVIITGAIIPPVPVSVGVEFAFALDGHDPISVWVG